MSAYAPGPGFPSARPAGRRSARWYALPAALLVLALALVATVVAVQWDELGAAGDATIVGPNTPGMQVELVRGIRYEVYVEADPTASAGPGRGSVCLLTPAGAAPSTVAVTGGGQGESMARDGVSYWYVGEFTAPLSGPVAISCAGGAGRLVVRPDDRPYLVLGGAALLGLLALVAFVVVLAVRRRRPSPQPAGVPPA